MRLPSSPCPRRWRTVACNVLCPQDEALGAPAKPLLSPFSRNRTEPSLALPRRALLLCSLAPKLFSSAPLSPQPPPPPASLPSPLPPTPPSSRLALRKGYISPPPPQLGDLIWVEGVGEATLGVSVWLELDTSHLLLCWQGIYASPLPLTSAKGELGRPRALQRPCWKRRNVAGPWIL